MGMLRASALADAIDGLDLRALGDPDVDSGVPGSVPMLRLVDAALSNDAAGAASARQHLDDELGPEATAEVAAVIGNFEMMNRIADGTGTPMSARAREHLTTELDSLGLGEIPRGRGA